MMRYSYIKERLTDFFQNAYTPLEWQCMKMLFAFALFAPVLGTLIEFNHLPYPVGVLSLADFSWITNPGVRIVLSVFTIILLILYLAEYRMLFATFGLFIISVFVLSIGESNGIWGRNGLLSMILFAQFIAYLFSYTGIQKNLAYNRVQFSIQVIAALYTLAAMSKLYVSGLDWISSAPNLALQVLKQYNYEYVTFGDRLQQTHALRNATWIIGHPFIMKFLFTATLIIEGFCGLSMINKKWAFFFGLLLTAMHTGMKLLMGIFFESISWPMISFCINPLFLILSLLSFFMPARFQGLKTTGQAVITHPK